MNYKNRTNQKYEEYWKITAAKLDFKNSKFLKSLEFIVDAIDKKDAYFKNDTKNPSSYAKLQEKVRQLNGWGGKDPLANARKEINTWIKKTATTDYHPSGTCKMGNDSDSVVNENLKVHGMNNLYVVDASIMPNIVSGNLNAPTQMIAEKFSDIILQREPLKPLQASYHFREN